MKKEIGLRIRDIRESKHMSKEAFAKMIGISGQYLGVLERGGSCLSVEKLKRLWDVTGLSADYILFGKDVNLGYSTNKLLNEFTDEQIEAGCDTIKKLANFIKSM